MTDYYIDHTDKGHSSCTVAPMSPWTLDALRRKLKEVEHFNMYVPVHEGPCMRELLGMAGFKIEDIECSNEEKVGIRIWGNRRIIEEKLAHVWTLDLLRKKIEAEGRNFEVVRIGIVNYPEIAEVRIWHDVSVMP